MLSARRSTPVLTLLVAGLVLAGCADASDSASPDPSQGAAAAVTVAGVEVSVDPDIAATLPASIKEAGVLKNITYDNAPPDTFVDKAGKTVGWEVDLGTAMAAVLGLKLETTTSGAFDTFIPGIQNGRYNVSVSSLIQTPERLEQIDVVTYYNVGTEFGSKVGSPLEIAEPTDLCGHTVSTLGGSAFVDQLEDVNKLCSSGGKPAIEVQAYPATGNMTLAVANGRAELFATSANQLAYIIQEAPGQFEAEELNYEPVAEGAGVTKGIGLTQPIAAAMDKLIETGAYEAVMKKWGITSGLVDEATIYSKESGS